MRPLDGERFEPDDAEASIASLRDDDRSLVGSAPDGLEVAAVEWHGEPRLLVSFPLLDAKWPATLTLAERAVAALLLAGHSNAFIASCRRTSERTVVNQVASIFRKARVSSRVELAARVFFT